ncbi:hypothetical protein J2794_005790 [Paraburkholderia terricola]|uniref:hypothetical protein n=1 Tax=Paraburkholderia terricola TaxID=169427 RepID=UPI00285CF778|nr:hypothetical protein [Paraburkholderia terricola]MDR6449652.1 hypothetical protein [Paraburkholderia terricola]
MANACTGADFYRAFKANMDALGLEVPASVSTAPANVIARVAAMVAAAEKLGKTASVAELIGATTTGEKLLVFGAMYASFWLGAAVGSLMVAASGYTECGKSASATMLGVRKFTFNTGMRIPAGVLFVLQTNPEIFAVGSPGRSMFVKKASIPAAQAQVTAVR